MTVISALQNVHVEGSFGNFENKSENELLKIKELKNLLIVQVVQYKNSSIKIDDIDSVTFDYMDHRRDFRTSNNYRLLIGDYIRSKLKIPQNKMFFSSHHYAHALSTFWPSGFDESTVMIVDGLGSEQQTHSIFYNHLIQPSQS